MRSASLIAIALCVLSPAAQADQPAAPDEPTHGLPAWFRIEPPAGWSMTPGDALAESLAASSQLGPDVAAGARVVATDGESLVVTWLAAAAPVAQPEAVVRAQLDHLRRAPEAASAVVADTTIDTWRESLAGGVVEARMGWKQPGDGLSSVSRTLIIRTATGLRQVSAECVRGPDAGDTTHGACVAAMESLAIALPAAELLTLDSAAISAPRAAPPPQPATGTSDMPRLTLRDPGQLGGERPVIAVQRGEGKKSYKSLLYALGALLLVAAFYLTARRDRSQSEDSAEDDKEKP